MSMRKTERAILRLSSGKTGFPPRSSAGFLLDVREEGGAAEAVVGGLLVHEREAEDRCVLDEGARFLPDQPGQAALDGLS
jgi:hypothetical protein